MKASFATLSSQTVDLFSGVLSLPAIVMMAVGLAGLLALAVVGGLGWRLLRLPVQAGLLPLTTTHGRYTRSLPNGPTP